MNTIPVLEKSIALVETLAASDSGLSAKHLSLQLGIPPATCYRILRTFVQANWLRENKRGEFQLAFGLAHVARCYADMERQLGSLAAPMKALSQTTGLSVKISVREGPYAITALRAEARRMNAISTPVGTRIHLLEAGSAGVILLAKLAEAEVQQIFRTLPAGYWERHSQAAVSREIAQAAKTGLAQALGTVNPAIYALSVPISLNNGQTAALTIVGWPDEFAGDRTAELTETLRVAARQMQELLSGTAGKEAA